ncbi:MAG: ATP-binding protein [Deltaproteobacteria bacterium]|nr:ATP-binding protein [Deltaproteobacteria bacterium]
MRFPIYSLRTGILAALTVLILLAMFLINVVMLKFSERDLVEARLKTGRLLVRTIGQWTVDRMTYEKRPLSKVVGHEDYRLAMSRLLQGTDFIEAVLVNDKNIALFRMGSGQGLRQATASNLQKVIQSGRWSLDFSGRTWGVIWPAPQAMQVSGPITFEGKRVGAVAVSASLDPLYGALRRSEKAVLIFIGLNALILVLFGLYLLSRTVVKPVHRLLRVTDEFEAAGDLIPEYRSSRNEIGTLYRSLRAMLKRLDENKKELKATISSLEAANRKLTEAQDEMIRSEKLASVGRLAAGIAHEIGNPIGIILGYLDLLKGEGIERADQVDFLNRVTSEITRINRILRELLDFARPSVMEHKSIEMHQLIEETLDMLRPQPMMDDLQIDLHLQAEKTLVLGDGDKLKQVLLNIVINAADAMSFPENESVSAEKRLTVTTESRGKWFMLTVSDTGTGIRPSDMGAIFDPFFTTKAPGSGTGLGLSVCYTIVEGLGGTIEVASDTGEGTTVRVEFPLSDVDNQ